MNSNNALDLRSLAPKDRYGRLLQSFDGLKDGEALQILFDHDPHPLYYQLLNERERRFRWEYKEQGPEVWKALLVKVPHGMGELADDAHLPPVKGKAQAKPEWAKDLNAACEIFLDVRPMNENGLDPFHVIMKTVQELKPGQHFHLVNSSDPESLYGALGRMGYKSYTEFADGAWNVYFKKGEEILPPPSADLFDRMMEQNPRVELDVRGLPTPQPLMRILESLPTIAERGVLYVHHNREPFQLLDKLRAQGFETLCRKISGADFKILVWKK
jgi:uncharacterized protein (DUF2249 family)